MTKFNLTHEPWIPVEALDGSVSELSTREVLSRAHELRALADPSPLVVATLTRHLLAILHRVYDGPRTVRAWIAIQGARAFDPEPINAYLDTVEDRMDLFHPTHPFAQVRGLHERFGDYATPIDELELVRGSWGVGKDLFRHRPEDPPPTMSAARAARALLAHHAFATGGLVKKPDEPTSATAAPLTKAAVVVIQAGSLFDTLVANLIRYDLEEGLPIPPGAEADRCAWEQPQLPKELRMSDEPERLPHGYLDLLTWQSRRVELLHRDGVVHAFINAVGQGMPKVRPHDPMVAYRRHEKLGWLPIGIDVSRAFWRDASALFESAQGDSAGYLRPKNVEFVARSAIVQVLGHGVNFDVSLFGISAVKSRIDAVRTERVPVRLSSLDDADAQATVREAIHRSEEGVSALRSCLWGYARNVLAPGDRDPDKNAVSALVDSFGADVAAWSALGVAFDDLMRALGDDPHAALRSFEVGVKDVIREVFRSVSERPDTTARWLKARAIAERSLHRSLAETNPSPQGATP